MSPEFVALQLALVERYVELGAGTWSEGVDRLTNLRRRLGLDTPAGHSAPDAWSELLAAMDRSVGIDERVEAVMAVVAVVDVTPLHIARGWPTVGAFSVERTGRVARTHFFSTDDDDLSPLHPTKLDRRRDELMTVLAMVHDEHPEVDRVVGGSWLYATRSYASLFPTAHLDTAVARRGRVTFHGMSHWGQFVDHRGDVRAALAGRFRDRVREWTGDDPCRLFPIETLEVGSPSAVFGLPRQR